MEVKQVIAELALHPEGTFLDLLSFNETTVGGCNISGESPFWEMHPDTDEFFFIIDGEMSIQLLDAEKSSKHVAKAGSVFTIPKGVWHKPASPNGVRFIYITPGKTLHSDDDDPRVTEK